eukprot:TRINITY_DN4008_c0_g4_i1.p1 TRINITY_DN4008_c0_g4~~TRINITY_DN4008_c0_g4_i1.p1  ORF type:complete len:399 (+),score=55.69 TRINITY_DN4008_c0_g4_i1:164-1360(+)
MDSTPEDFRCPISLELMSDPVILCTGQTYDRSSIQQWLESGKRTCPNTTIPLQDTKLIPNYALRSLISQWAQAHGIDLKKRQATRYPSSGSLKTLENLVKALSAKNEKRKGRDSSVPLLEPREAVREIKILAKESRESRLRIVEAGTVARILPFLSSGDSEIEHNAIVVLFYLSLDDDNKVGLVAEGAVESIVSALGRGSMDSRAIAAVTLTSLAMVDVNKATIGNHPGAISALVRLLGEGNERARKEATTALYSLCFYSDNKRRAIAAGAVPLLFQCIVAGPIGEATDRSLGMINMLMTVTEGRIAIGNLGGVIETLVRILKEGTIRSQEHSVSILCLLCCNNKERAMQAREAGILGHCRQLLQDSSARTKRKAQALIKALHESLAMRSIPKNEDFV